MSSLELAISIGRDIERVGALAGYAAILGLAVLSLLYFAQSREVKRLREWAGRAPERDAELQQRVAEDAARRAAGGPAAPAPAAPRPAGANVPATAAALAAKPPTPAPPATPAGAPVKPAAAGAAKPPAAAGAGSGTPAPGTPPPGAPAPAGAPKPAAPTPGAPKPPVPSATPGAPKPPIPAAPGTPPAARPRRTVTVGSTPASASVPAREDRDKNGGSSFLNTRTLLLSGLGVALLVVVLLVSGVLGGGDDGDGGGTGQAATTTTTATVEEEGAVPAPADTAVAVLNGTTVTGLARTAADQLEEREYTVVRVTDAADQAQQTSQVAYSDGFRGSARRIARIVGVDEVVPLDESTRVVAGNDVSVVVTMAADKAE